MLPLELKKKIFEHFYFYKCTDRLVGMHKKYWKCGGVLEMTTIEDYHLSKLPHEKWFNVMEYLCGDIFYKFNYFFCPSKGWNN